MANSFRDEWTSGVKPIQRQAEEEIALDYGNRIKVE
jgi:hypothetical protein